MNRRITELFRSRMLGAAPVPRSEKTWRNRLQEVIELFIVPFTAAILPWPLSRRLMRWLSRWPAWYVGETSACVEFAARAGFAADRAAFARRVRWRLLVEHIDGFLVPLRSRRYIDRYVRVDGDPLPTEGPLLLVGTHYGCGYWLPPYMRLRGMPLSIVAPQLGPLLINSSLLENLYARMRHRLLARAAGRPMIYRGNAANTIRDLLRRGETTFGLCDMPTQRADAIDVQIAGMHTRLAQSMFELAAECAAPVYLFMSDTELESGLRRIRFVALSDSSPADGVRQLARLLDDRIRQDPTGWRFWSIAESFFGPLPALADAVDQTDAGSRCK